MVKIKIDEPLEAVAKMTAEIEQLAASLKRQVRNDSQLSRQVDRVAELGSKIRRASAVAADDVAVLERVIGETHNAIDRVAQKVDAKEMPPPGAPRARIDWIGKKLDAAARKLDERDAHFHDALDRLADEKDARIHDAVDRLTDRIGWPRAPRGTGTSLKSPTDRIDWITKQVR